MKGKEKMLAIATENKEETREKENSFEVLYGRYMVARDNGQEVEAWIFQI